MTRFIDVVRQVLADGEWHSFDELYKKTSHMITPEQAVRRVARDAKQVPQDLAWAIAKGKHRRVGYYLTNYKQAGILEMRTTNGTREYRLLGQAA